MKTFLLTVIPLIPLSIHQTHLGQKNRSLNPSKFKQRLDVTRRNEFKIGTNQIRRQNQQAHTHVLKITKQTFCCWLTTAERKRHVFPFSGKAVFRAISGGFRGKYGCKLTLRPSGEINKEHRENREVDSMFPVHIAKEWRTDLCICRFSRWWNEIHYSNTADILDSQANLPQELTYFSRISNGFKSYHLLQFFQISYE